jgi:hypothetical protein
VWDSLTVRREAYLARCTTPLPGSLSAPRMGQSQSAPSLPLAASPPGSPPPPLPRQALALPRVFVPETEDDLPPLPAVVRPTSDTRHRLSLHKAAPAPVPRAPSPPARPAAWAVPAPGPSPALVPARAPAGATLLPMSSLSSVSDNEEDEEEEAAASSTAASVRAPISINVDDSDNESDRNPGHGARRAPRPPTPPRARPAVPTAAAGMGAGTAHMLRRLEDGGWELTGSVPASTMSDFVSVEQLQRAVHRARVVGRALALWTEGKGDGGGHPGGVGGRRARPNAPIHASAGQEAPGRWGRPGRHPQRGWACAWPPRQACVGQPCGCIRTPVEGAAMAWPWAVLAAQVRVAKPPRCSQRGCKQV